MDHVVAVADQVVVMHDGRVVAKDTPAVLFNRDLDWFKKMKLDLPKAGQFAEKLMAAGMKLPERPLTLTQLATAINTEVGHE